MKYLLGGYYGMRNVGDDVLLYVTLAAVSRLDSQAVFTVVSDVPVTHPDGIELRTIPGGRPFTTLRQLWANDIWLFGGGGLLQDRSGRSLQTLRRLRRSVRVANAFGRKVAFVGIGVGPLETREGRAFSRELLERADFVTVRDQESAALAAELIPERRIAVTADLAFLLPSLKPSAPPRPSRAGKVMGVSLLAYSASLGGDRQADVQAAARVAEALNQVLSRHPEWKVKLFEFFAGSEEYGDAVVLNVLREHLAYRDRVAYRTYQGDLLQILTEVSECHAFLGMRFHSCVLASLAGVPCLMIGYHPKCASLAARLQWPAEALASVDLLEAPGPLAERLERLLRPGGELRPAVPAEVLASEATRNFDLFGNWLQKNRRLAWSPSADVSSTIAPRCVQRKDGP